MNQIWKLEIQITNTPCLRPPVPNSSIGHWCEREARETCDTTLRESNLRVRERKCVRNQRVREIPEIEWERGGCCCRWERRREKHVRGERRVKREEWIKNPNLIYTGCYNNMYLHVTVTSCKTKLYYTGPVRKNFCNFFVTISFPLTKKKYLNFKDPTGICS